MKTEYKKIRGNKYHNYDISWDYELDNRASKNLVNTLHRVEKQIKKLLTNFEVYAIILPSGCLGVYCNGTSSCPTIGIDLENCLKDCKGWKVPLSVGIRTTILHELAHSLQDSRGKSANEDLAEDFAWHLEKIKSKWNKSTLRKSLYVLEI